MIPMNLQFWPHADQDVVDLLPRDHWFSMNYHRLLRTPTRSELCSFYIPVDIIENRPAVLHQRLREALAFILREAVRKEDAVNKGESMATHEQIEAMASTARQRPQHHHAANKHRDLQDVDGREEAATDEAEMMRHISNWNATGRMHRTETHWVPVPSSMPSVPVTTPTNGTSLQAGTQAGPAQDEPMHHDEVVNDDLQQQVEDVPVAIPDQAVDDDLLRLLLVERFREEILQDMMHDYLREEGVTQYRVCPHKYHHTQLDVAVLKDGQINGRPYMVVEHITRHDWHPVTGNCIYTVGIADGPPRRSAETLANHYWGVPYAIWEYWGKRTRVRRNRVTTYVDNFGTNDFYRVIMWHWLGDERWLHLWRSRRASRRG
ncbi:hypothetical protein QFC24_000539 [Naganishia onofrii]|uniref:Uncharacterized protein n=1 Tax=Naganishia onofrii TaxID=1851511 RepID=A0ACC2XY19_9TREE|nr:hypothetical protein QFC24_000539 [Naganishia onofrii]